MSFRAPAPGERSEQQSGVQVANRGSSSFSSSSTGGPSDLNSSTGSSTKLVFGLGSKTNRLKHDEYAERRSRAAEEKPVAISPALNKVCTVGEQKQDEKSKTTTAIRATKYGNFYRQQVTTTSKSASTTAEETKTRTRSKSPARKPTEGEESSIGNKMKEQMRSKEEPEVNYRKPSRMQFSIPPPPKAKGLTSGSGKASVVSYAKSRIYERPLSPGSLLKLEASGQVPASISSGIKPPKQVMVSKAREQWEGGEPFAKCKSRQRLAAAQAGRKLLQPGAWSLASVVATQQQQFSGLGATRIVGIEPQVRILTRGSVLERVQQFEKPAELQVSQAHLTNLTGSESNSPTSSGSSSPTSSSSSSLDSVCSSLDSSGLCELKPATISTTKTSDPLAALLNNRRRRSSTQTPFNSTNTTTTTIPKFYHPFGKPNTYEIELQKKNIVAAFDKLPERKAQLTGTLARRHFHTIAIACGFSEYFKEPLAMYVKHQLTQSNLLHGPTRLNGQKAVNGNQTRPSSISLGLQRAASIDNSTMEKLQAQTYVTCDQFLVCWRQLIGSAFDQAARFVHLLTLGSSQRNHLLPDDFVPLIMSVIEDHPGLKFLRAAPDFHMRYIQTVIARIYYCVNKSWTGKISLHELRQSNLLDVLQLLSKVEDINQVTDYFSYEHFYVIYCKFWSLDQDHDLLISKEDLARHNDAAISSRIIERIFMGIVSKQIQTTGKMSYSDFVWFLMAEEDKKHPRAIEYWFRLMDLDGDGYISMYEMEYFYYEQTKRLELMNIEALPFIDSACQILDLVNPKEKSKISLSDLKRTKMAPIFFDTFINLEKYLEHESREFVSSRDVILDNRIVTDWERYASEEYESLVSEETSV